MGSGPQARWAVDNPAIARGRLLTAARTLNAAAQEVSIIMGLLDLATMSDDTALAAEHRIELGMDEIQRQLLHAVHALDFPAPAGGGPK